MLPLHDNKSKTNILYVRGTFPQRIAENFTNTLLRPCGHKEIKCLLQSQNGICVAESELKLGVVS